MSVAGPSLPHAATLGASIVVHGDVSGEEDLIVLGRVEGAIDVSRHSVTIGKGAHLGGNLAARRIVVEGEVDGDVVGLDSVLVRASGSVVGNIRAGRVAVEDGCRIRGSIDMTPRRD